MNNTAIQERERQSQSRTEEVHQKHKLAAFMPEAAIGCGRASSLQLCLPPSSHSFPHPVCLIFKSHSLELFFVSFFCPYCLRIIMTGFDFSNCNRNAALHAKGVPLPKATSTGTTIVGCTFDNGVVVSCSLLQQRLSRPTNRKLTRSPPDRRRYQSYQRAYSGRQGTHPASPGDFISYTRTHQINSLLALEL